jgi:hypothetical protein
MGFFLLDDGDELASFLCSGQVGMKLHRLCHTQDED